MMRALPLLLLLCACGSSQNSNRSAQCFCPDKYDGNQCVTSEEFVPLDGCEEDGNPVCGCDGTGYTSSCAAYAVGVQVAYPGPCRAGGGGGGGGGGGFDFGW
jgi:hypothetical protein